MPVPQQERDVIAAFLGVPQTGEFFNEAEAVLQNEGSPKRISVTLRHALRGNDGELDTSLGWADTSPRG
jgi:hypothetical protein